MALSCSQIIKLALQAAKAPGYTSQAGQFLNSILADLAEQYDFDIMKVTNFSVTTGSITPPQGPYPLPVNYLRACPDEVSFLITGEPFVLVQIPLSKFVSLFTGPGITTYPGFFATDMSTVQTLGYPTAYLWPPVAGVYQIFWHYFQSHTDIVLPETSAVIPWFPSSEYLIAKVAANVMMLTDDDRMEKFDGKATMILDKYLMMKDDPEGYAQTVKLDRNNFPSTLNIKSTKQTVW